MATKKTEKKANNAPVFQFMSPDEQDNLIISCLNRTSSRGGKSSGQSIWNESAILVRRQVILELLGQGLSHIRIKYELMSRWGICKSCAEDYIKDAIEFLKEGNRDIAEDVRDILMEKIQAIAEESIIQNDRKSALQAYDMLNKMLGHYTTKIEADVDSNNNIHFDFGE